MATTLTKSQVSNLVAQAFGYMFLAYTLLQLALGCIEISNKSFEAGGVLLVMVVLKFWFISTGFQGLRAAETVTPTQVGLLFAFSCIYAVVVIFQIIFYSFAIYVEQHQAVKTQIWVIYFLVLTELILFSGYAISLNKYLSGLLSQLQSNSSDNSVAMVIPEPKS